MEKAYIVEISDGEKPEELSPRFNVQFNPTSLKLQVSTNKVDQTMGSQVRQTIGSGSTVLTLELVFDTADEGTTENPRSVREKTEQVERYTLPKNPEEINGKPPKIRFQWGSFFIDGVVDGVNVDLDHFAANGTPLRAKVGLTIKEQKRVLIFAKGNQKGDAPSPLAGSGGALGFSGGLGISAGLSISAGINAQVGVALNGESLPEFSARVGLDPAAWRGLSTDVSGGLNGDLSLSAGTEVAFNAGLNANAGLGVTLGAEAGVGTSLEASFGLEAAAGLGAVAGVGAESELAAGFALAAGGGLNSALETVRMVKSQAAVQQARQAFDTQPTVAATAVKPAPKPAPPVQPRPRLALTGLPAPSQQSVAPAAPQPPRADPRAAAFGFGVPLRSTVGVAAAQRSETLAGGAALRQQRGGLPSTSNDPTVAPWIALPPRESVRRAGEPARNKSACGCSGLCRHRGGR